MDPLQYGDTRRQVPSIPAALKIGYERSRACSRNLLSQVIPFFPNGTHTKSK